MPKCKKNYKSAKKYRKYTKEQKRRNYERGRVGCYRHGWTEIEESMVLFSPLTDRQLSLEIHHSVAAIQKRRYILMKNLKEVNNENKII